MDKYLLDTLDFGNGKERVSIYTFKKYARELYNEMEKQGYTYLSRSNTHPLRQIKRDKDYDYILNFYKD